MFQRPISTKLSVASSNALRRMRIHNKPAYPWFALFRFDVSDYFIVIFSDFVI